MTLEAKIEAAVELIRSAVAAHPRPVVCSSFGKDSMVLLSLIARAGLKLPILFFREPFHPKKYAFANRVILENDYVVYDYPPLLTMVSKRGEAIEILNLHATRGEPIYLPTGIRPPEGGDFLCGLIDLYAKPTGTFTFPWDLLLIGHKSTDKDPIVEDCYLKLDEVPAVGDGPALAFPLRHFTDEDVWAYTEEIGLPINTRRYNRDDEWKEFVDITFNPDYFHACTACIDRDNPPEVFCPRLGQDIPNVAPQLRYFSPETLKLPAYVGKE